MNVKVSDMTEVKIWHNNSCSKSRQTMVLLEEHGVKIDIKNYLVDNITIEELRNVVSLLGIPARGLIRTKEDEYKDLGLDDLSLGDEILLEAMVKTPKLIERPIVINGNRATLGRPPINVLEII